MRRAAWSCEATSTRSPTRRGQGQGIDGPRLDAHDPRLQRRMLSQVAPLLLSAEDSSTEPPPPVVGWAAAFVSSRTTRLSSSTSRKGRSLPIVGRAEERFVLPSAEADGQ